MSQSKLTPVVTDAREFFSQELRTVMEKRQIQAQPGSFDYLVDLMLRYLESHAFFAKRADGKLEDNLLVRLYSEYMTGTPEVKKATLRRLGDICMLVTGLFPDSLNRKLVDIDYYFGMGGAAYATLAKFSGPNPLYEELSLKFRSYSNVIFEMSEKNGMQSNGDILRAYERWLHTGSDRLKELLAENGITAPIKFDTSTRH